MKRIYTDVEKWQYSWLAEEAEDQGTTMSRLLRHLLTEAIERQQALKNVTDPIFGIVGLATGPNDGITSENLDDYLYRFGRQ